MTAVIWLFANVVLTPIETGGNNTRLGFLLYGVFQLFTWGLVPLFLLTLSIVVVDLIVFKGKYSRQRLVYETLILASGLFVIAIMGDAVGTGVLVCSGFVIGQIFRGRLIEAKLLKSNY